MSAYYDHVEMEKHLQEDKLCTKYLKFIKEETYPGYRKVHYTLTHENKEMRICYYPEYNKLEAAINIPYFLFGHNFCITLEQEKHVVEYLSNVLDTDIFEADAKSFEHCSIFEIPYSFQEINNSHIRIKGMTTKGYSHGKYFSSKILQHRIYDVQRNIHIKLSKEEREILKETTNYCEDKFYMKVENRYIKPELALKNRGILVKNLFEENITKLCDGDLLNKYQSIKKAGSVDITSKKQLHCAELFMIALKQLETVTGESTEILMKKTIKSYSHILSPDDQKSRIAQMKRVSKKIQSAPSVYDVSDLLLQSLNN